MPASPASPRPSARRRAFTLLELIVVIVVLGILAALAIPTFAENVNKAHDEVAISELSALQRAAQAVSRLENSTVYTPASLDEAFDTATLDAATAGTFAGALRLERLPADTPSTEHGKVSAAISADGTQVEFAMRSKSGRCAFVAGDLSRRVSEQAIVVPDADCVADGVANLENPDSTTTTAPGGETTTTSTSVPSAGDGVTWTPGDGGVDIVINYPGEPVLDVACYEDDAVGPVAGTPRSLSGPGPHVVTYDGLMNFQTYYCEVTGGPAGPDTETVIPTAPTAPAPTTVECVLGTCGTITEPAVPADLPMPFGNFNPTAMTSFPSTHAAYPHAIYAVAPSYSTSTQGGVFVITEQSPTDAVAYFLSADWIWNKPQGITVGDNPELVPAGGFDTTYRTLYVAENNGSSTSTPVGRIWSVDPSSMTRELLVSDMANPRSMDYGPCSTSGGHCLYVQTDTGVAKLDLATRSWSIIVPLPYANSLEVTTHGGVPSLLVTGTPAVGIRMFDLSGTLLQTWAQPANTFFDGDLEKVGDRYWATNIVNSYRGVVAWDPATNTTQLISHSQFQGYNPSASATTLPRQANVQQVHFHGNADTLYVSTWGSLDRIDLATNTVSRVHCGTQYTKFTTARGCAATNDPVPANDAFVAARAIPALGSGQQTTVMAYMNTATMEPGEPGASPEPDYVGETGSVWFTYTPAQDQTVTFSMFDPLWDNERTYSQGVRLGVKTGSSIDSLTTVGYADGAHATVAPDLYETMALTGGTTYYLHVTNSSPGAVPITLTVQ